jgi:hypothetical protein
MSEKSIKPAGAEFVVDMPDRAPALGFDPSDPAFTWRAVYPSNFWNLEELEERRKQLGGWPVLTPARVVIRPVFDPSDYDGKEPPAEALKPKLVIEFAEAAPGLVLNKSRCEMLTRMTGSPNPQLWAARLGPVSLSVGVFGGKAQIIVEPVQADGAAAG